MDVCAARSRHSVPTSMSACLTPAACLTSPTLFTTWPPPPAPHLPPTPTLCRYTFQLDPGRQQVPLKVRQGITVAPAEGVWVMVRSR
jgi:hypothetical protein